MAASFGGRTLTRAMRVLVLDGALAACSVAILADGEVVASRRAEGDRGHAARLPGMAQAVLDEAGVAPGRLDLIAATVGPGSFTGLRAALSLAQGLALASGVELVGVTVGEALAQSLPQLGRRALWVATDNRRGGVFLERAGQVAAMAPDAVPDPAGPVALAGDSAGPVAARLAARGADVMLTNARRPTPRFIALAAMRRLDGTLPPLPAQPLYVDAARGEAPRHAAAAAARMIRAAAAHARLLAALHAAAFPPGARWGEDAMVLQLGLAGGFGFVDPAGGMVLARAVGDEAEILTLAVRAAARRRGVGRALLRAAMAEAAGRGAAAMFLEVGAANAAGRALYTGEGFAAVGCRRRYYPDGGDALVLRATLSPCGSAHGPPRPAPE